MSHAPRGVLVIDKPSGPTSHDVVRAVRRALRTRSAGHTGTLDPLATGVLVVAVGEATKLVAHLTASTKQYDATIVLGEETDTLDAAGAVVTRAAVPAGIDRARIEEALAAFHGTVMQRAPAVSAIKVGGRTLHSRVRRGEAVVPPVREVWLGRANVVEVGNDRLRLAIECGKGFYVRSLARDLAVALGTVGHLAALRRTRNGRFGVEAALPWASVEAAARGDEEARSRMAAALIAPEVAWDGPRVTLTDEGVADARHGRAIARARALGEWPSLGASVALLDPSGTMVAIGVARDPDRLSVVRGLSAHEGLE